MGKGQLRDQDSLGNSDLSHVSSIGEVVIARARVTVLPRLLDEGNTAGCRRLGRCSTDSEVGPFHVCSIPC